MKDREILYKAIIKAGNNNYIIDDGLKYSLEYPDISFRDLPIIHSETVDGDYCSIHLNEIIFSHDFAKAFWGEKAKEEYIMRYSDMIINEKNIIRWKYYLKEMVLERQPLRYLEKFL